jgi:hypothetical protein
VSFRRSKLPDDEWLDKQQAAKFLGISTRQIENHAQFGRLAKRRLPKKPSERAARVVYDPADLAALKAGAPQGETALAVMRSAPAAARPSGIVAIPVEVLDILRERREPPPEPKFWLTPDEAVAASGLPREFLVAQARSGAFRAVNVGRGKREFWRFNREALAK